MEEQKRYKMVASNGGKEVTQSSSLDVFYSQHFSHPEMQMHVLLDN